MTQRFARRKRARVRLTRRDFAVVRAVFEARYLTNRQVCRLLFTPGTFSWCKQRLPMTVLMDQAVAEFCTGHGSHAGVSDDRHTGSSGNEFAGHGAVAP